MVEPLLNAEAHADMLTHDTENTALKQHQQMPYEY
jgi:hypothetical protein